MTAAREMILPLVGSVNLSHLFPSMTWEKLEWNTVSRHQPQRLTAMPLMKTSKHGQGQTDNTWIWLNGRQSLNHYSTPQHWLQEKHMAQTQKHLKLSPIPLHYFQSFDLDTVCCIVHELWWYQTCNIGKAYQRSASGRQAYFGLQTLTIITSLMVGAVGAVKILRAEYSKKWQFDWIDFVYFVF